MIVDRKKQHTGLTPIRCCDLGWGIPCPQEKEVSRGKTGQGIRKRLWHGPWSEMSTFSFAFLSYCSVYLVLTILFGVVTQIWFCMVQIGPHTMTSIWRMFLFCQEKKKSSFWFFLFIVKNQLHSFLLVQIACNQYCMASLVSFNCSI